MQATKPDKPVSAKPTVVITEEPRAQVTCANAYTCGIAFCLVVMCICFAPLLPNLQVPAGSKGKKGAKQTPVEEAQVWRCTCPIPFWVVLA